MSELKVVNIAGYRFEPIAEPQDCVEPVRSLCGALGLKGSVLLSTEGVNVSLAGGAQGMAEVVAQLPPLLGMDSIPFKRSDSSFVPFDRLRVRVRPRLLPVGDIPWDPGLSARTQLPATTLRDWLREGRDILLIDTRNDYEYDLGSFEGAVRLPMDEFARFEEEARTRRAEWSGRTIVTFCTGGIRCEKAVPVLVQRLGHEDVYQLQGGILQYFEEVGGEHWRGDCFVFDKRVALDPSLAARPRPICASCGKPALATGCTYCEGPAPAQAALQSGGQVVSQPPVETWQESGATQG